MFKGKINLYTGGSAEEKGLVNMCKRFLRRNRSGVHFLEPGSCAVLLVSGGIDSTALWFYLLKNLKIRVFPFFLQRSKTHDSQLEAIVYYESLFHDLFPDHFEKVRVIDCPHMFSFRGAQYNLWTRDPRLVLKNAVGREGGSDFEIHMVSTPTRLGHYVSSAVDYLYELRYEKNISISTIILGLVPSDRLSRGSSQAALLAHNVSACATTGDYSLRIIAPFDTSMHFYLTKRFLHTYALKNGLSLSKTWSCSNFTAKRPCGRCISCINRQEFLCGTPNKTPMHTSIQKSVIGFVKQATAQLSGRKQYLRQRLASFKISEGIIVETKHLKEKSLLYTKKGTLVELNKTGQLIWKMAEHQKKVNVDTLLRTIRAKLPDKSPPMTKNDLDDFLKRCVAAGIIQPAQG